VNLNQLGPTTHTAPKNPFAAGSSQNYKWDTQQPNQPTLQQMQGQVGMNTGVGKNVTGGSFPIGFNNTGGSFGQTGFVQQNNTGGFSQQGFQSGQQRPVEQNNTGFQNGQRPAQQGNPFGQANFFN
jgi:hypothetical protein